MNRVRIFALSAVAAVALAAPAAASAQAPGGTASPGYAVADLEAPIRALQQRIAARDAWIATAKTAIANAKAEYPSVASAVVSGATATQNYGPHVAILSAALASAQSQQQADRLELARLVDQASQRLGQLATSSDDHQAALAALLGGNG